MKKRAFSLFLVFALVLTALAGCGQDNDASSKSDKDGDGEEEEQLLGTGLYEVTDEDDEPAGYLEVKKSKITVYDGDGEKENTLSYEYNAKKERYEIDDGELFGSETFTVEQSKKKLTLITEDEDEYTLEEIDELPGADDDNRDDTVKTPKPEKTNPPEEEDGDYIELPTGCYAVYDGRSLVGYMKVTRRTMIIYEENGYENGEYDYSYERDGSCTMVGDYEERSVCFTDERGDYYMYLYGESDSVRLEPIDEDEIPEYDDDGGTTDASYIGGNGSMDLYLWLPEEMRDDLDTDRDDDNLLATAGYYDYDNGADLIFYSILSSGDSLEAVLDVARQSYGDTYSSDSDLLFYYLQDIIFVANLANYGMDSSDYGMDEGDVEINSRSWRYCDLYIAEDDTQIYMAMLLWMRDDSMALVFVGGEAEDAGPSYDISDFILDNIISTLELNV